MDLSVDTTSWWIYVVVFLAAATPVLEVLVVIPAAVIAGMHPGLATLLALAGNLTTVILAIVAGDRVLAWWRARRPAQQSAPRGRSERARRMAQRWGVPALAFVAPITTGSHIGAVVALTTGAGRRHVTTWMTAGLTTWALLAGGAAAAGLQLLT